MPQLVERFLQQAFRFESRIRRETVGGIPKSVVGNDGEIAAQLGFSEHKGENRDKEVLGNDSEYFPPLFAPGCPRGSFESVDDIA